ncbi:MAG: Gfo/Idh/MocA family oxidoreductase [Kiritimatiellae bacterium]|nr:Gfo/Idh/MocA family oxidoreductase [Kiritimatiellia bacterium]
MKKKRYAIIGMSGRSRVFTGPILKNFADRAELAALLDNNPKKMEVFNQEQNLALPMFGSDDFDRLVREARPDAVIISTTDNTHHRYIIAALKHHLDVICEKPMTTDTEKVRAIRQAALGQEHKVRVTFNCRYAPVHSKIKAMIMEGAIGRPVSVDFNDYLDTYHGASFFKRWNRYVKMSGSLLVTKACHHFDLVNWWLGKRPEEVFAYGALNHYGPKGEYNPEQKDGRRCSTCGRKCRYFLRHSSAEGGTSADEHLINFNNPGKNELFGAVDGYYGDRCLFDSDIDTWDTFSVTARYDQGAFLTYSLNASAPYEGYRVAINGTRGRLETEVFQGGATRLPFPPPPSQDIHYYPLFEGRQIIGVVNKGGGHGGGDPLMLNDIFMPETINDPTGRAAGLDDGVHSVLLGVAARESLQSGHPVAIKGLLAS